MNRRIVLVLLSLCACTSRSVAGPSPSPSTGSATRSPSPSGPKTQSSPFDEISGCRARSFSKLRVVVHLPGAPDDLYGGQEDGSFWVSDPVRGTLRQIAAGRVVRTIHDPDVPEGIVDPHDGRLLVAEQGPNRVVSFVPPSAARAVLVRLPDRGSGVGVDGIGYDSGRGRLLIPDSPHGHLYAVPLRGGSRRLLASGLGRAVGADIGPDGKIYVAAEGSPGLWRIPRDGGRAEPVGDITQADDVISAGSLLWVTLIDKGEVVAVDPATGDHRVLVTAIGAPQGLMMLFNGPVVVADSHTGIIAVVCS